MPTERELVKSWPYPRYKEHERTMQKIAAAWFASKNLPVQRKKPHILASRSLWRENIILGEVADYIEKEQMERVAAKAGFPLHQYLHHGLSSQAMVFNLVGPLITRNDLDLLSPVLERAEVSWPKEATARFEDEDRDVFQEYGVHATSIDLAIYGNGKPIFIESKLTERNFGGCSLFEIDGDCDGQNPAAGSNQCYLTHIGRTYWPQMIQHGFLEGPLGRSPVCPLANHYQFFREVIYAIHKGGHFVLLYDRRHPNFVTTAEGHPERGTFSFLVSLLPAGLKDRVKSITIQEVIRELKDSPNHSDWTGEFEKKYGLDA